jgi:hypothetical protein
VNAKGQNMVYNAPRLGDLAARPQELLMADPDGYRVCVSAVAPVPGREPAFVTYRNRRLTVETPERPELTKEVADIRFVARPHYYNAESLSRRPMTRVVSACGLDELNVWPWHDCAISATCGFCGINKVSHSAGNGGDMFRSLQVRGQASALDVWARIEARYLEELTAAVEVAAGDACYDEHLHLILISGNLADDQLDDQARIYARIAAALKKTAAAGRFSEGVVAVTAPPSDLALLDEMRAGGVDVVVFNLEAFTPAAFQRHCPGKDNIGRSHYAEALRRAVGVFGRGATWCNFVLGLESSEELLAGCEELASGGIVPGANVLHLDVGGAAGLEPPDFETVVHFYRGLGDVCRRHGLRPYYCARALRTSLANEAFDGRL